MKMTKVVKYGFLYFIALVFFSLFSYSLTDPNLVLLNHPGYWQFQQMMWQTFFANRQLLAASYLILLTFLFVIYFFLIKALRAVQQKIPLHRQIIVYFLLISPLVFAYNALSHDVFNYIFNARMMVEYGADPHLHTAIEFPNDLWTRFMHNTHTPAPYGRGWTLLSLLPYSLGLGKFFLTWLSFRFFALISIILTFFAVRFFSLKVLGKEPKLWLLAALFLNPLLIIEVGANQHNDLWMMAPAVAGLGALIFALKQKKPNYQYLVAGLLLWGVSIYLKLATVVLAPLVIVTVLIWYLKTKLARSDFLLTTLKSFLAKIYPYFPDLAVILLFMLLFTNRSQQFHPWYLLWILPWLPLVKTGLLRVLILIFSVTSMWRYLPWLLEGGFTPDVLWQQRAITWIVPLIYLLIKLNFRFAKHKLVE